jgi:hypothetical protein
MLKIIWQLLGKAVIQQLIRFNGENFILMKSMKIIIIKIVIMSNLTLNQKIN